jgi:hypothetical protein
MTFTALKSSNGYKMLRPGDADFTFSPNGVTLVPRASLEISSNCPGEYRHLISQAYRNGWLKPVANMRNTEYTMELLKNEYAP